MFRNAEIAEAAEKTGDKFCPSALSALQIATEQSRDKRMDQDR